MSDTDFPEPSYAPHKAGEYRFIKDFDGNEERVSIIADEYGSVKASIELMIQMMEKLGFRRVETIEAGENK